MKTVPDVKIQYITNVKTKEYVNIMNTKLIQKKMIKSLKSIKK